MGCRSDSVLCDYFAPKESCRCLCFLHLRNGNIKAFLWPVVSILSNLLIQITNSLTHVWMGETLQDSGNMVLLWFVLFYFFSYSRQHTEDYEKSIFFPKFRREFSYLYFWMTLSLEALHPCWQRAHIFVKNCHFWRLSSDGSSWFYTWQLVSTT